MGTFLNWLAFTISMITTDYATLIFAMAIMGLMATVRLQICLNYMYEVMKIENYTTFYTTVALGEGIIGVIVVLYFWLISKDAQGILWVGYVISSISILGVFLYPETPRYLVKLGDLDRAR